jgi:hypothetical protein
MPTTKQPVVTKVGTFTLTRSDEPIEFVCDNCIEPKTAKITVRWDKTDGTADRICNKCYGKEILPNVRT